MVIEKIEAGQIAELNDVVEKGWRGVVRIGKKVVWRCDFTLKRRDESAYLLTARGMAKDLIRIIRG